MIVMSNYCTHFLMGMRKHIIQNFIEAITHGLQHCSLNINMLRQHSNNVLKNSIDILLVKNVDCNVFVFRWEILLYEN